MCRFKKREQLNDEDFRNCKWSHFFSNVLETKSATVYIRTCLFCTVAVITNHIMFEKRHREKERKRDQSVRTKRISIQENLLFKSVSCGDISVIFTRIEMSKWRNKQKRFHMFFELELVDSRTQEKKCWFFGANKRCLDSIKYICQCAKSSQSRPFTLLKNAVLI